MSYVLVSSIDYGFISLGSNGQFRERKGKNREKMEG